MPRDNYEIAKENARRYFLTFDQADVVTRPFISSDSSYFITTFAGQNCRISRETGTVELQQADGIWKEAGFNAALTVYDLLCYSRPDAQASGEFVTIGQLNNVFTSSANSDFYRSHAVWFNDHQDALNAACRNMGGIPADTKGDIAWRLPMTDFLPIILQFWEADEEFPPSLTLLVDSRILDFMHFETIWYAVGHIMDRLKLLADIFEKTE